MINRLFPILVYITFLTACMPEENLPIRNVGETPKYFIECYCKPGAPVALAATPILPIDANLDIDYSLDLNVQVHARQNIELYHILHTLPESEFIYNYGSYEYLQTMDSDSLHLSILTQENESITASTSIPSAVRIYTCNIQDNDAVIQFYLSEDPSENYYIYSVEAIQNDSIVNKEVRYLDYSRYSLNKLIEKSLNFTLPEEVEKIIFTLKRITRANYDYQISLNAANNANQSSITTPVPLKGNIEGALGIFTCYTEERIEMTDFNKK